MRKLVTRFVPAACLLGLFPGVLLAQALQWPTDTLGAQIQAASETDATCVEDDPVLLPGAIGPVSLELRLEDLVRLCSSLEPGWHWLEGMPGPALLSRVGGATVLVELFDTAPTARIYRISTVSPEARTEEGVGPGMGLSEVFAKWPDLKIAIGEGVFAISESHPWLSLRVARDDGFEWPMLEAIGPLEASM